MKLTKTQTALLTELAQNGYVYVGRYNGTGACGGRVRGGNRSADAALQLERMGLLVRESYSTHPIYNRGYCIHTTDIVYVAPPANNC